MSIPIEKVKTDGFEMNFFRFGRGKKNLVVIPGLSIQSVMGASEQIAAAYDCFSDDFTVFVFDRRTDIPKNYTVKDMADDTAKALKKAGLDEVYLFGASQGGMIVLEIAADYPEIVKKAAVGSTTSNLADKWPPVLDEWLNLAEKKDKKGLYLAFGSKIYPLYFFERHKNALIAASETVTDDDLARFAVLTDGMRDFNITDSLKNIRCPTFVIGAYDDAVLDAQMTSEIAKQLEDREDFELFMYEGFGHAAFDTAPDYRERLYKFFVK